MMILKQLFQSSYPSELFKIYGAVGRSTDFKVDFFERYLVIDVTTSASVDISNSVRNVGRFDLNDGVPFEEID
jgi:hypothetical protein